MAGERIELETVLAGLHDIRLPSDAAGGLLSDLAVAAALGLGAAILVAALFGLVARGAARPMAPMPLADALADLRRLPDPDRTIALLHLAKARAPGLMLADRATLYAPSGLPDAAAVEEALLRHAGRDA